MKRKIIYLLILALTNSLVLFPVSFAQDTASEEIKLYLGENQVIPVSRPTKIVIGNPRIADIGKATKQEVTIVPKAKGVTSLVIWDNFGEQDYRVRVFAENLQEVKRRIDVLLSTIGAKGIEARLNEDEEKIFLLGEVKSQEEKDQIKNILGPLAEKTTDLINIKEEGKAIEIDVQVLELDKGATSALGLSWPSSITLTEKGSPNIADVGGPWGTLFQTLKINRAAFALTLDTLVLEGKARILSRPKLVCQNGKKAKLLVGGEVPILSATVGSGASVGTTGQASPGNVEYKEYGIILNIQPNVRDDEESIKINLDVEVSEVGTTPVSTSYASAYPFTKRTVSTELFLDDGQTMGVGGLIKQKKEEDLRKFPWLADVPMLGSFFRKRTVSTGGSTGGTVTKGDTELFITLTPRIINKIDKKSLQGAQNTQDLKKNILSIQEDSFSSPEEKYANIVRKKISDALAQPELAKSLGFSGTVKVKIHLSYQGKVLGAEVKESSGYSLLDEHTVELIKGMTFPPFPPELESKEFWIEVPVSYIS